MKPSLTWSQDVFKKAYRFAADAHQGQLFPGTELPYLVHISLVCMEVQAALAVENQHDGNLAIQCALLHDVIEDTETTYDQVKTIFGVEVANGVLALTKEKSKPKSERMKDSLTRIRQQPTAVWMVKLADRISNLDRPPEYWTREKKETYREEAGEIYQALQEASPYLALRLKQKIADYRQYLD